MLVVECESVEFVGGFQPSVGSPHVDGTVEEASGISSLPSGQGFKIQWKKGLMMEQDGHASFRDFFALMNVKQSVIHLPKIGDCIKKNSEGKEPINWRSPDNSITFRCEGSHRINMR